MPALQLVVGLGNPGPKYSETRHNAGFWFVDRFAGDDPSRFRPERKFHGELARLSAGDRDCLVLKPHTYMNESGRSVRAVFDYHDLDLDHVLVVHDEVDFEPGVARLKRGGGHGGHNGLEDVIAALGADGFLRLRLGVGHPGSRDEVISYVLKRPRAGERERISSAIDHALDVMPLVLAGELEKAMTRLHTAAQAPAEAAGDGP